MAGAKVVTRYNARGSTLTLRWNGEQLVRETHRAAAEGVFEAALIVKEQLQINIGIMGPPRSLPGDFPHVDTSELQDSVKVHGSSRNLEARVIVEADYARPLEFGHGSVAPRPFMLRTLEQAKKEAARAIINAIRRGYGNIRFAD